MNHLSEINIYTIDHDDRIQSVSGDWDRFAVANDAAELVGSNILNTSFWNHICGDTTIEIYRQILTAARAGKLMRFDLRCDSPERRRFLNMTVEGTMDNGVRFEIITKSVEERASQEVFRRFGQCSECVVVTCSWCKRIRAGEGLWYEVEEAVPILGLFEVDKVPQLSHGMCEECYEVVMRTITTPQAFPRLLNEKEENLSGDL